MKVCANKVETQNLASHEDLCAIWRCGCVPMKVCTNKVETQNLASHEELCAIWRCGCVPMKVCVNKVETQDFASPEGTLRYMAARMCANESVCK